MSNNPLAWAGNMQVKCCTGYISFEHTFVCPQCVTIKCPKCLIYKPVSWFCQQCSVETTKLGARLSGNRCARNCISCPHCTAPMRYKTVPDNSEVLAKCCQCDFEFIFPAGKTLGAQAVELRSAELRNVMKTVDQKFGGEFAESELLEVKNDAELPKPVNLRAKNAKLCRKCGSMLVEPEKQPKTLSFVSNHTAVEILPRIEIYNTSKGYKIVAWGTGSVRLLNSESDITLTIPTTGYDFPLFLVERETIASRQAFMRGATDSGTGWASAAIESPANEWMCIYNGMKYMIHVTVNEAKNKWTIS